MKKEMKEMTKIDEDIICPGAVLLIVVILNTLLFIGVLFLIKWILLS